MDQAHSSNIDIDFGSNINRQHRYSGQTFTAGIDGLLIGVTFPDSIRQTNGEMFAIIADYPDAPPPGPGMAQGTWMGTSGRPEGAMIYGTDGVTWYERENYTLVFQTWVSQTDAYPNC